MEAFRRALGAVDAVGKGWKKVQKSGLREEARRSAIVQNFRPASYHI
jgi:hypothetical protein